MRGMHVPSLHEDGLIREIYSSWDVMKTIRNTSLHGIYYTCGSLTNIICVLLNMRNTFMTSMLRSLVVPCGNYRGVPRHYLEEDFLVHPFENERNNPKSMSLSRRRMAIIPFQPEPPERDPLTVEKAFFSLSCTCLFDHVHEIEYDADILNRLFAFYVCKPSDGNELVDTPSEKMVVHEIPIWEVGHPVKFSFPMDLPPWERDRRAKNMGIANNYPTNRHFLILDDPFEEMHTADPQTAVGMKQALYVEAGAYQAFNLPEIEHFLVLLHGTILLKGPFDPQDLRTASRKEQYCFRIKQIGSWTRYVYLRSRPTPSMLSLTEVGLPDVRRTIPVAFPYEEDRDVEEWPLELTEEGTLEFDRNLRWTISPRRYVFPDNLVISKRVEDNPSYIEAWNRVRRWVLNYYLTKARLGWRTTRLSHDEIIEDILRERGFPVPPIRPGARRPTLQEFKKMRVSTS
jgi:hypothetical protein